MDSADVSETCFLLLDSILDEKSAAYVAGPLDTGKIYYQSTVGDRLTANIRKLNQDRLTRFVRELRCRVAYPVIDPGILRISLWSGADYSLFFIKVIGRYAKEVWFIDGWEFSSGATKEFEYCVDNSIPCLNENGAPLSLESGKHLILRAISFVQSLGLDASKLLSHVPKRDL